MESRPMITRRIVLKGAGALALALGTVELVGRHAIAPQRMVLEASSLPDIQFDIGAFIAAPQTFNDGGGTITAQLPPGLPGAVGLHQPAAVLRVIPAGQPGQRQHRGVLRSADRRGGDDGYRGRDVGPGPRREPVGRRRPRPHRSGALGLAVLPARLDRAVRPDRQLPVPFLLEPAQRPALGPLTLDFGRTMPALIRDSAVSRTDSRSGRGVQPSSRTAFSVVTSCWMPSMSTASFASLLMEAATRRI